MKIMKKELFLILHNIRSAYNVGAIFRTADGAGVSKIYLTGYTPIPSEIEQEKQTAAQKMIAKTALGAEKSVPWQQCEDLQLLLQKLQQEKISIVALEKTESAIELKDFKPNFPLAFVLGNEVEGVDEEVLQACSAVVSIPMRGKKESLNVSVAAGIAIYKLLE